MFLFLLGNCLGEELMGHMVDHACVCMYVSMCACTCVCVFKENGLGESVSPTSAHYRHWVGVLRNVRSFKQVCDN
jgi:hypothetical protein